MCVHKVRQFSKYDQKKSVGMLESNIAKHDADCLMLSSVTRGLIDLRMTDRASK